MPNQDRVSRKLIGVGERRNGLYYLRESPTAQILMIDGGKQSSTFDIWHKRMGHPSGKVMHWLAPVSDLKGSFSSACDICFRAKQTRDSFPDSNNKTSRIFELIHCDLWGPYNTPSSCGAKMFLTIVDDYSRAVWIYLLLDKTEVFKMFMAFIAMVERQFSKKVCIVRSDNGTEFNRLKQFFRTSGIIFQTSCVGTPQQNGRVERKHRHVLNVARALRFQANLPINFWGECVLTAAHLINRTPLSVLNFKTPYEILFGVSPCYQSLRVFGCLCYVHNLKSKGDKFASRSRKCIFVGYVFGKKGWNVFDLETHEYFVSRDVKFLEDQFPFAEPIPANTSEFTDHEHLDYALPSMYDDILDMGAADHPTSIPRETTLAEASSLTNSSLDHVQSDAPASNLEDQPSGDTNFGRGLRTKQPSVRLKDYVTHTVIRKNPIPPSSSPSASSGTPFPISHYVSCDNFSVAHRVFLAAISSGTEPQSFREAVKHPGWRDAMQVEIQALEKNSTWTLMPLPSGKRALGCRWVYKIKYHSNGTVERLKARLVIFGNRQVAGLDYTETFAPVAKMVTVRAFLAVAACKNWELHQMDVHNAFLHGDLNEEVYMTLPPGYATQDTTLVCKLRKSLYGLKQAPRCWFAKLVNALQGYGFIQSFADYSLFTRTRGTIQLNVLVYVDDLVISGNDSDAIASFKAYLSDCFHMKDLGNLKYFLGIEVARSSSGLFLTQRKYALDIITETGLLGAKPVAFPIEQNHDLAKAVGPPLADPEPYRRLLGRLIYLVVTRPDLAYAVHILSQFLQNPRHEHWNAALRVVRYLKGSPGQGILLRADGDLTLTGWCDSDWAACPLTRKSLSGWLVFLGHSPVSWKTKKQTTVARSSAEAEYRSMAAATCELKWLKALLLSLGIHHPQAIPLYCDSQSALHIARNPVFHERTKHIEVDCHFVRNAIQENLIAPSYVPTTIQLADIFTKALGKTQFQFLLRKLGILDPHAPT
ncbi:unnamed protein product [Cuscuta epithymum]|uniref:Integrase catalytic domain-containing protein n=1 Tax=Cuscuta epithymum TaxID=186058 RepID=A0AAV0G6W2_9ASTE|nr:unnamed protein product [Cuscuta epithymum]